MLTAAVCLSGALASGLVNDRRVLARGSGVTFDEYEAEYGTCGWQGTPAACHVPQPGNRSFGSFSSESSGRQSVCLAQNSEYVEIVATAGAANSVVVRYSIPDAPTGGGINSSLSLYIDGAFHSSLAVTSRFAWDYGYWSIPYSENPADGGAHHFFDEVRVLLASGQTIRQGSVVRLQIDASRGDTAEFYMIDLIDLESVASPKPQPPKSLSIVDFGAQSGRGGGPDARAAIQATLDVAAKRVGWSVWIPAGEFAVGAEGYLIVPGNTAIIGAGMWHSNLLGNTRFKCGAQGKGANNCSYADFAIQGVVQQRTNKGSPHGFVDAAGKGSSLSRIWVEHTACGYWVGQAGLRTDGLMVSDCRIRNTYADGVNLCNGARNSVVKNSHFRNTGDDSVATWSPKGQGGTNANNLIRGVTAQLPWRANCFAIYGGHDHTIEDCRCFDTISYPGVMINAGFNANAFQGTTVVRNTSLIRAGGPMYQPHTQPFGSLVLWGQQFDVAEVLISGVTVDEATFSGVQIRGDHTVSGVVLENTTIARSATYGVEVRSGAKGRYAAILVSVIFIILSINIAIRAHL